MLNIDIVSSCFCVAEMTPSYDSAFYARQREGSKRSARIILPIIFDLIKPQSVVDVGCGVGTWLSVASELGVRNLAGFEGNWAKDVRKEEGNYSISFSDLECKIATADRFDLAMCLEVAEHLSEPRADSLIADLCSLSDVVLFGAAIPGQGGTNHVNEQWQSYWANHFQKNRLLAYDVIRPEVWTNDHVRPWYRQNILLYSRKPLPGYQAARMIDVVHRVVYEWKNPPTFRYLVGELPRAFKRAIARRL